MERYYVVTLMLPTSWRIKANKFVDADGYDGRRDDP